MLNSIDRYFVRKADQPVLLRNKTFGFGDRFYKAEGHFNLLNPCNVWVSEIMKNAGMGSGLWTPTSYSLLLSQYLYN